jgi:1-acyl-sn-glycerol-3-phosphate acyltransferase
MGRAAPVRAPFHRPAAPAQRQAVWCRQGIHTCTPEAWLAFLASTPVCPYTHRVSSKVRSYTGQFPYPRRRILRFFMRQGIRLAFRALSRLRVEGRENMPASGPLLVVANHFHFLDPVAVICVTPWPLDFLAGLQMVNAPAAVTFLPKMWGVYSVRRGGASRNAMRAAMAVLAQDGVLGVMPEGGNWASVLRPARPGAAYLAVQTGAPLLPIGLDGLLDFFPALRQGHRPTVTVRIGRPFGPFRATGHGRELRQQLEEIGDEIMRHIAELIPPQRRGVYSEDPALRAAAEAVAYPYDDLLG